MFGMSQAQAVMLFDAVSFSCCLKRFNVVFNNFDSATYSSRGCFILRQPLVITDGLTSYNWTHKSANLLS